MNDENMRGKGNETRDSKDKNKAMIHYSGTKL